MTRSNSPWYTQAFKERFVRGWIFRWLHKLCNITTFQLRVFIILVASGWLIIFLLTFLVFYVIYKNVSNNLNGVTTKVGYIVQTERRRLLPGLGRSTDGPRMVHGRPEKSIGQSTSKMYPQKALSFLTASMLAITHNQTGAGIVQNKSLKQNFLWILWNNCKIKKNENSIPSIRHKVN